MGCGRMTESVYYDFAERAAMSHGVSASDSVADILMQNVPGAVRIEASTLAEDKSGTDWWVRRYSDYDLAVDCKVREEDWSVKPEAVRADDLALEIWSVKENKIPGWTLRQDKRTDYVLWLWSDTGRWCLIPFPMLCAVFRENGRRWCDREHGYKRATQTSRNGGSQWTSECVFVPRVTVWDAILRKYGGGVPSPNMENSTSV